MTETPTTSPSPDVVIQPPQSLPYAVQKAIFDIMAEIITLSKDGENDYAGYNYASVDAYYLKVIPICLKHGIRWDLTTTGYPRRDGNIEWWPYSVTLHFVDDREKRAYCYPDYAKVVVKHPLRGPQDTGTTMSYADKSFTRQFLKVPTGEPDGDETDNRQAIDPSRDRPMENLPDPTRSRSDRRATDRKNGYIERVRSLSDAAALETYMRRVSDDLAEMERQDMGSYRAIMSVVEDKRRELAHAIRDRVNAPSGRPARSDAPPPPHREQGRRVLRPPE